MSDPHVVARLRAAGCVWAEDEAVLAWIGRYLSTPMGPAVGFKTCMFVNSPDEHFIVDTLPEHRPEHPALVRTDGHPQADLARALTHVRGHEAIEARERERQAHDTHRGDGVHEH